MEGVTRMDPNSTPPVGQRSLEWLVQQQNIILDRLVSGALCPADALTALQALRAACPATSGRRAA